MIFSLHRLEREVLSSERALEEHQWMKKLVKILLKLKCRVMEAGSISKRVHKNGETSGKLFFDISGSLRRNLRKNIFLSDSGKWFGWKWWTFSEIQRDWLLVICVVGIFPELFAKLAPSYFTRLLNYSRYDSRCQEFHLLLWVLQLFKLGCKFFNE